MKNLLFLLFVSILLCCSCNKNSVETNGFINDDHIVWHTILDSSIEVATIYDPIIYEDIIIFPKTEAPYWNGEIIAMDKNSGKILWTWKEALDKYGKNGFSIDSYAFDGVLAIGDNNYTAGINIYTGETIWENLEEQHSLTAIHGGGETIFKNRLIPNEKCWIEKANIHTGQWETIYQLEKKEGYNLGSKAPNVIEENGKLYITFLEIDWKVESSIHTAHNFLYLYNVTDNQLVWKTDTIPVDFGNSGIPGVFPTYNEGKILLSNDAIFAYNFEDGTLAWKEYFGNSFTFSSRITAADGKVYGNNGSNYFVGLDVHSGKELFRTDTGGSPSRVVYHEGNCYLASVSIPGDGNFFLVINGTTGEMIHKYNESDHLGEEVYLDWALTVDPETGYAYTSDHKHALCFDFE